jgi:UDP-N-acetylglucosamine:LPS N-acetylglucosamine transferase
MKTIDLVYFNAGGGHRAAAQALQTAIRQQGRPWQVRCVNLVDMLDPQARFQHITGMAPEALYNKRLARGWTLGMATELKWLQRMISASHATLVQRLQQHWSTAVPDLVVSLIPNFNRALHDSLAAVAPGVPFVTVMTDMADLPPHFWIEPDLDQHLVCGTDHAVRQALAVGCDARRVHRTSGMVIRPDFYQPPDHGRAAEQARLGLDPARPTGVVMFGGQGSMAMLTIARQLSDVQLVLMCGHHQVLAQRLRALPCAATHAVVEFTPQVRRHLAVGDFFLGKPGPGCLSEAVQQGLPVLTVRNAWTMPQERYNTDWVEEVGVGIVGRSLRQIRPQVLEMLERLGDFKAAVQRQHNRAVFEVPDILEGILQGASRTQPAGPEVDLLLESESVPWQPLISAPAG